MGETEHGFPVLPLECSLAAVLLYKATILDRCQPTLPSTRDQVTACVSEYVLLTHQLYLTMQHCSITVQLSALHANLLVKIGKATPVVPMLSLGSAVAACHPFNLNPASLLIKTSSYLLGPPCKQKGNEGMWETTHLAVRAASINQLASPFCVLSQLLTDF